MGDTKPSAAARYDADEDIVEAAAAAAAACHPPPPLLCSVSTDDTSSTITTTSANIESAKRTANSSDKRDSFETSRATKLTTAHRSTLATCASAFFVPIHSEEGYLNNHVSIKVGLGPFLGALAQFPPFSTVLYQLPFSFHAHQTSIFNQATDMSCECSSDDGDSGAAVSDTAVADQDDLDHALALSLQLELEKTAAGMSSVGQAWAFCHQVAANHARLRRYNPNDPDMNANNFSLLDPDDMDVTAERMFEIQKDFQRQGKDVHVDIGYHYTQLDSMDRIRTDGLLTMTERQAANIVSRSNGASFGDGVYTCANAFSYHKFAGGDQGLFVARIQGQVSVPNVAVAGDVDTILGRAGDTDEVCVLQSSSQCVPLIKFDADLVELYNDASAGNAMVHSYHCSLQEIVDNCFNGGTKTHVARIYPSEVQLRSCALHTSTSADSRWSQTITYAAPDILNPADALLTSLVPVAEVAANVECSICLADLSSQGVVVALADCSHQFHQHCIEAGMKVHRRCPLCRAPIGVPQGNMPSGSMQIDTQPDVVCTGHAAGTIAITYRIDEGCQKEYHEYPGERHGSATRVAYLPDSPKGRDLLKRLKFAFSHGMVFTVGTSLSSGETNAVTWASIHHKTSLVQGPYGYPDAGYFINVNGELDALHVPHNEDL